MIKKTPKKLTLAKETVRTLESPMLKRAAGGIVETDDTICCHSDGCQTYQVNQFG